MSRLQTLIFSISSSKESRTLCVAKSFLRLVGVSAAKLDEALHTQELNICIVLVFVRAVVKTFLFIARMI